MQLDARDELVLQRVMRSQTPSRVPAETAGDEVQECLVIALESLAEFLGTGTTTPALR